MPSVSVVPFSYREDTFRTFREDASREDACTSARRWITLCGTAWLMSQPTGSVHQFGPFRYDPAQRLLFRDGQLIPLVPKAIDTLHALLEHRGQVVGKAALMKAVWRDCVVEDVGLARNISLLRKALGDDAEAYIETIPKRGYRFAAEVDDTDARHGEAAQVDLTPLPRRADRARRLRLVAILLGLGGAVYWQFYWPSRYLRNVAGSASLAVIPFECLSPDLEREAFSQGFAETLVAEISKLKSVQVISPGTVKRYQRLRIPTAVMARLLGLHVVVEGTAQRFGQQLRISVRLTDVHSGKVIWAERYDVGAIDTGQTQNTVAQAVAVQIAARLSAQ